MFPLAKFAFKAHALGDLECRDNAPLDLLAGLSSSFAGPPVLPAGLIEVSNKSVALDWCRLKACRATSEHALIQFLRTARNNVELRLFQRYPKPNVSRFGELAS